MAILRRDCLSGGARDRSEGSRESEDWMSEMKDNIRLELGEGWSKAGVARCEKCVLDIG